MAIGDVAKLQLCYVPNCHFDLSPIKVLDVKRDLYCNIYKSARSQRLCGFFSTDCSTDCNNPQAWNVVERKQTDERTKT